MKTVRDSSDALFFIGFSFRSSAFLLIETSGWEHSVNRLSQDTETPAGSRNRDFQVQDCERGENSRAHSYQLRLSESSRILAWPATKNCGRFAISRDRVASRRISARRSRW